MNERNLNYIVENFITDTLSKFKTWGSAVKGAVTSKVNPMTGAEKVQKLSGGAASQAAGKVFNTNNALASQHGHLIAGDHDTNYEVPAFLRRGNAKEAADVHQNGTPTATGITVPAKTSKYYKEPEASKSSASPTSSEREEYSGMSAGEKKDFFSKNLSAQGRRSFLRARTLAAAQK